MLLVKLFGRSFWWCESNVDKYLIFCENKSTSTSPIYLCGWHCFSFTIFVAQSCVTGVSWNISSTAANKYKWRPFTIYPHNEFGVCNKIISYGVVVLVYCCYFCNFYLHFQIKYVHRKYLIRYSRHSTYFISYKLIFLKYASARAW